MSDLKQKKKYPGVNRKRDQEDVLVLTDRQLEVLKLLSEGKRPKDIAELFNRTKRCIDDHIEQIYSRMGVNNKTAAINMGIRKGLIPPIQEWEWQ